MLDSESMSDVRRSTARPEARFSLLGIAAGLAVLLLAAGCGGSAADPEVDHSEIEAALLQYLPKLGEAYAKRDASLLEGLTVPKEMSRINLRAQEFEAGGRVYEPEFQQLTVEDVSVWNYSNAFVSTLEVWDVRSYTLGTHMLLQEAVGQRNRVKYQMKRKGDGWVILYRELAQTLDS